MPDIVRDPAILKRKRLRQGFYAVAGIGVVVAVTIALARMEPASPTVDRATVLTDTVTRGSIVRQVRGLGTLVPEDTRWIPATTEGRVERIRLRPGAQVGPNSVILELSNPQLEQEALNAMLAVQSAEAALENQRILLRNELLQQQSSVASREAEFEQAQMDAEANEALAKKDVGLISEITRRQSQVRADTSRRLLEIERTRLESADESIDARMRVAQAAVDQARGVAELQASRIKALQVTPGFTGVLQSIQVEVGQRIGPGTNLARVADPTRLKAELRISETQARDVEVGQEAQVDTRNGVIPGLVSRKDPAAVNGTVTVDVTLTEALPRGAVPDLSVDGTVQLELLENVLNVGRPSLGQEQSTVGLFRLNPETAHWERTPVQLGRSSVNKIEVISGLAEGDQVVLTDMSNWDAFDRVRLR